MFNAPGCLGPFILWGKHPLPLKRTLRWTFSKSCLKCFASDLLAKSAPGNKPWYKKDLCENYVTCIKICPFWKIAPDPPAFATIFGPFGWKMEFFNMTILQLERKTFFVMVLLQIFHLLLRFCQWKWSFTLGVIYTVSYISLWELS